MLISPAKQIPISDLHTISNCLRPLAALLHPKGNSPYLRPHVLLSVGAGHDRNVDADQKIGFLLLQANQCHFDPSKFGKFSRFRVSSVSITWVTIWCLCCSDEVALVFLAGDEACVNPHFASASSGAQGHTHKPRRLIGSLCHTLVTSSASYPSRACVVYSVAIASL